VSHRVSVFNRNDVPGCFGHVFGQLGHVVCHFYLCSVNIAVRFRYLTPNFGTVVRDRYYDSLFGSAGTVGGGMLISNRFCFSVVY
jgi:hypothetical protein